METPAEQEIEGVEKIPVPKQSTAPRTAFSDALKAAENGAGHQVEVVKPPVKVEAEKEAVPDFIPEELLSKEPAKEADAAKTEIDEIELPSSASAASKHHFGLLKSKSKETIASLRTELETLRKTPAPNDQTAAELKSERERVAALQEKLERHDFTQSPRYQQFEARAANELAGAKAFVDGLKNADGEPIDSSIIDTASHLSGAKRIGVLRDAGLDAETIAGITPYLASLDTIGREKKTALDNYKTEAVAWQEEERQRSEQTAAHAKEQEDRLFGDVAKTIPEKLEVFRKVAGQEAWNKQVDQLNERAKEIFSGQIPMTELAEVAHKAAAQEVTQKMNLALREKVKTLQAQLGKLTAAQPSLGAARTATTQNGERPSPRENWNSSFAAANNGAV